MVIYRLAPGEIAPWSGSYRLVGHYGERTGRTVDREAGERLPTVEVEDDAEMWFVLGDQPQRHPRFRRGAARSVPATLTGAGQAG